MLWVLLVLSQHLLRLMQQSPDLLQQILLVLVLQHLQTLLLQILQLQDTNPTDTVGTAATFTDLTATRLTPTDTVGTAATFTTLTATDETVTRLSATDVTVSGASTVTGAATFSSTIDVDGGPSWMMLLSLLLQLLLVMPDLMVESRTVMVILVLPIRFLHLLVVVESTGLT